MMHGLGRKRGLGVYIRGVYSGVLRVMVKSSRVVLVLPPVTLSPTGILLVILPGGVRGVYRAQTLSVSFLFSPSTLQLFLFNSATLQLSGFTSPILPPPSPLPIITLSILHRTLSSSSVASDGSAIPLNNRPDVGRSHWPRLHGYAPTCLPESSLTVNSVPAPSVIPVFPYRHSTSGPVCLPTADPDRRRPPIH